MKKIITLAACLFAAAILFSACSGSTDTPESPKSTNVDTGDTKTPEANTETGALDLSTVVGATYENGTIVAKDIERFKLPLVVANGKTVKVHVTGTNNGTAGFRIWLTDNSEKTDDATIINDYKGEGLPAGDFDITTSMTASADNTYLFFKGASYGTNIDDIVIKSIAAVIE